MGLEAKVRRVAEEVTGGPRSYPPGQHYWRTRSARYYIRVRIYVLD